MARPKKSHDTDKPIHPDDWEDDAPAATESEPATDEEPPEAEPAEDESETVFVPVAEGVEPLEVGTQLGRQILADLGERTVIKHRVAQNGKQVVITSDPTQKFEYLIPHLADLF